MKTASPATYASVGDVVVYSYLVTNSGNVSLAGPVTVADDKSTDELCPAVSTVGNNDGFLDPGESITCSASYTITQADLNAGSVTNVASASADGTTSPTDTETVTAVTSPTTPPTASPALGSIGNLVWEDRDADGVQDPVEPGVAGVTVELYDADTDVLVATQVTDVNGNYLFENLPPGDYYLVFILPASDDEFVPPNVGTDPGLDSDADNLTIIGRTDVITVLGNVIDNTWDAGVAFVAVAGVQITTTTVAVSQETLPFTGAVLGEGGAVGVALAMLALGGVALLTVRRREEDGVTVATGWSSRLWDVE